MHSKKAISAIILIAILLVTVVNEVSAFDMGRLQRHKNRIVQPVNDINPDFSTDLSSHKLSDFADLKLSETVSPAAFTQANSSSALLAGNSYVIVWQDDRDGYYCIYAQKYSSSGARVGGNVKLVGRDDGYDLIEPKVVPNGSGGFYLAYRDVASGKIWASNYDSEFNQSVFPFVVNNTPSGNFAGPFDMDNYGSSRFAVAWEDYGISVDISLRFFNPTGTPLSDVITITDDISGAAHWVPSIAFDDFGNLGVTWEDYRNGNADIYFQFVNTDGSFTGTNIGIVAGAYTDSAQYLPEIEYSDRDGFAISWLDRRNGNQQVYLQRYIRNSGLTGSNVQISSGTENDWDLSAGTTSGDDLVLAWSNNGDTDQILAQKFTTGFALSGSPDTASFETDNSRWGSYLSVGANDDLILSWTDTHGGNMDIYSVYIFDDGTPTDISDPVVNSDLSGAFSSEADISLIDNDTGAVVFTDTRNDDGDIFLQRVNTSGGLVGSNIKVNSDTLPALQNEPAVSSSIDKIMIVWNDSRALEGVTGQRIFVKITDHDGVFAGDEFVISDSSDISIKYSPAIASVSDGTSLAAWVDLRSGSPQVYARLINSSGEPVGSPFMVSNSSEDFDSRDVHVTVDGSNIFSVIWLTDNSGGTPNVVIQKYSVTASELDRYTYESPHTGFEISDIAADVSSSGEFYIVWEGSGSDKNFYFTRLSSTGTITVDGSQLNQVSTNTPFLPAFAVDRNDDSFAASWVDDRSGKRRVYYQLFASDMTTQGIGYVSSADYYTTEPTVAINNNTAWFSWTDTRVGGKSIYSRNISFVPTDVVDEGFSLLPQGYELSQNYPNPFNPSTTFEFSLPSRSKVRISVYNILGEEVAKVTDQSYDAGNHSISWEARDESGTMLPTGIYLYKMTADDFKAVRKLVLMK